MLVLQLLGWQQKKIVGCSSFWQMASPVAAGKKVVFSELKGLKAHWDNCVEVRERMKDFGPANSHEEPVMFQQMDFEPDIWSEAKLLECCMYMRGSKHLAVPERWKSAFPTHISED